MRALGAQQILELCDADGLAGTGAKALAVLSKAMPAERLEDTTIGQRDALLMAVYEATFAPKATLALRCPSCAEKVEVVLAGDDIGLVPPAMLSVGPNLIHVEIAGHRFGIRPVTAGVMSEAGALTTAAAVRRHLLWRCVVEVDGIVGAAVPSEAEDELERHLAEADPLAEIELENNCPACGTIWSEIFDAADLVWNEVVAHGARLMSDVAILARTYHWSERDILAMPARRRRFYLESALG